MQKTQKHTRDDETEIKTSRTKYMFLSSCHKNTA